MILKKQGVIANLQELLCGNSRLATEDQEVVAVTLLFQNR